MKRILHVISTLEQGGTEAVVLNYFNNIDKDKIGFDFLVVWGDKKGYYEDYLLDSGCKIFKLKNGPNNFWAHGKELKAFFKLNKYEIVHIHAMSSLRYRVAKAAKKAGVKTVIYHSHSSSNQKHFWLHKILKGELEKWCDFKFACSVVAGKYMFKNSFQVINNAIDLNRFVYDEKIRLELRTKYNLRDSFVIGNVGRLSEEKNQKFILKVAQYLKMKDLKFFIFFVGEGEQRESLERFAKSNNLSDNLILAGAVGSEVFKYYSLFDCLVFPSLFEGLSLVLLEAQANGIPIIASEKISEENKIAENFFFLPIDETESNYIRWADTLSAERMKRESNQNALIEAGFDIEREAKKLQEFYLNL